MSAPPQQPSTPELSSADVVALNHLDEGLLAKYKTSGPRYTSYPTAPLWKDAFGCEHFKNALVSIADNGEQPLSIYTHLPFCESRCLFCSCNVVITRNREQVDAYLAHLFKEIAMVAESLSVKVGSGHPQVTRPVRQFHLGGGTPTYLSPQQLSVLMAEYRKYFTFTEDAEIAIEVDPRVTTDEQLVTLRQLGFTRISLGVQDFYQPTQEAIHRIQPIEQTETMVKRCRELGYGGINFDLIYGLPHQTEETFANTLDEVIRLSPDRIALYNFAYVPWMSPHQQALDEGSLPSSSVKFAIFKHALTRLMEAGYVYIGMDHFSKPTDELTIAWQEGSLHRNFMGYTTAADCELVGLGVSAISGLNDHYGQNQKTIPTYYAAIDDNQLPTHRGLSLTADDHLRRLAIHQILCDGRLNWDVIDQQFEVDSRTLFDHTQGALADMASDGLIIMADNGFTLTLLGRVLSRNIAMLFDAYLDSPETRVTSARTPKPAQQHAGQRVFSQTV